MEILDNVNRLFGDDLRKQMLSGSKVTIAASCFSIFAFEALMHEFQQIESPQFKSERQPRQFQLQDSGHERGFFGTEFEIHLKQANAKSP